MGFYEWGHVEWEAPSAGSFSPASFLSAQWECWPPWCSALLNNVCYKELPLKNKQKIFAWCSDVGRAHIFRAFDTDFKILL